MSSVEARLSKLREERAAREKARIEKLRELNLKKYNKNEPTQSKSVTSTTTNTIKPELKKSNSVKNVTQVKNSFNVNGTTKRPITAPANEKKPELNRINQLSRPKNVIVRNNLEHKPERPNLQKIERPKTNKIAENIANISKICNEKPKLPKNDNKVHNDLDNKTSHMKNDTKILDKKPRKSIIPVPKIQKHDQQKTVPAQNQPTQNAVRRQSVFERLYQPKATQRKTMSEVDKLKTDPDYMKKVIKTSNLIVNKLHTLFEPKKANPPVRRSISAVHFKRISSSELKNCVHKWSSIGDKLNKAHLKEIREDASVNDRITSAVKSERKKVKFATPSFNFNTPRPEELQMRLQNWLQKRGKSLDSYHHLQCFGIHHLRNNNLVPLNLEREQFDPDFTEEDEDKENVPLESDSDDDSYTEIMNEKERNPELSAKKFTFNDNKWRRASNITTDSVDLNETQDTTLTSTEAVHHVDDLLFGALGDLTELLREGFDWEQCARWLRAIRQRFPSAPDHAAYWECRAALEERRGDLASSVQCWEEAIAKGTERSVVESNLDQLLDKFMQLKISPSSGNGQRRTDPKLVDIKNVFKSTLIKFAVQQAKIRQSQEPAKFTVTPVRRSARLSAHWSGKKTPLQICSSVKQATLLGHPVRFVPNHTLAGTP